MAETEVIENEIASKKFNRQLETVDIRVVSELVAELRGARMFGYDYIDIAKLERGILAVAALQGFSQVLSAEEAIYRLADSGSEVADRIKGLEEGNDTLADEL